MEPLGATFTFIESLESRDFRRYDLIIVLVHLHHEFEMLRKARESGCDAPFVGWFWDNHHHVFDNVRALADLDVTIPGHAFAGSYLRSRHSILADPVPLCTTQWTAAEAQQCFERHGEQPRSNKLYGGFVRYDCAAQAECADRAAPRCRNAGDLPLGGGGFVGLLRDVIGAAV